jgi:hypothetical protein
MQSAQRNPRSLHPKQWPGEREPTQWDVREANENLEATFLERFRVALLHREGFDDDASSVPESAGDSSAGHSPVSQDSQQRPPIWPQFCRCEILSSGLV